MKPEEITAGVELRVPAGADLSRKQTYYARVDEVANTVNGYVHAFVTLMNAAGRVRTTTRHGDRGPATAYAMVNAEMCSLRVTTPVPQLGPGTPYGDRSGLLRPPAGAVGLSAFRVLPGGETGRQYSAVRFTKGWHGVERFIRILRACGYVRPSDADPKRGYAVLDVLNADEDIIGDYEIPTSRAFQYVKRQLKLTVEPDPTGQEPTSD